MATTTPRPAGKIQGELSLLADGLGTALDELREVSHGIHPAILSEAGLGPALEALARRSAVPVELDLNLGPRLGEHVEAGRLLRRVPDDHQRRQARTGIGHRRVRGRP